MVADAVRADDAPTAVITGGNRGVGYAVAEQLLHEGYQVVLVRRDATRGAAAAESLRTGGQPPPTVVTGDLSTLDGVRATAAAIRDRTEPVPLRPPATGADLATLLWAQAEQLTGVRV